MGEKRKSAVRAASEWIAMLQESPRLAEFTPLAQRFVFSLRLIAVYRKAGQDPLAELVSRLGSVAVAIKTLDLIETLAHHWPEPVQVRRCCCHFASHDELTMANALGAVVANLPEQFSRELEDLIGSNEQSLIWNATVDLVSAELANF